MNASPQDATIIVNGIIDDLTSYVNAALARMHEAQLSNAIAQGCVGAGLGAFLASFAVQCGMPRDQLLRQIDEMYTSACARHSDG